MRPTKTAKTEKQPLRKKAAEAGKKEKSPTPKSVKGSGVGAGTNKKKKPAKAAVTVRDETSGKKKNSRSGRVRVKHADAASSAATAVRRKTPAKKDTGEAKTPKTVSTTRPAKNLRKTASMSPKPKRANLARRLPVEEKSDRTAEVKPDLSAKEKKSSAQAFPKRAGDRSNMLQKTEEVKSPAAARPMAIEELLPAELPQEYGESEFFLIPVEPHVVYASWEIPSGGGQGELEMRFFDVTRGKTGGTDSRAFLNIAIRKKVGGAFFNVGVNGREVIAEIGHRGADGIFKPLLTSRKVLIPGALEYNEPAMAGKLSETDTYGSRPPENS